MLAGEDENTPPSNGNACQSPGQVQLATESGSNDPEVVEPEATTEGPVSTERIPPQQHENDIFNIEFLKQVINGLQWDTTPRMTRDGTKEVLLHNKKFPDENLKYLIFALANLVTAHSNLAADKETRKQVLEYSATLLFYDHGYKQVQGISSLDKTWGTRLENAFVNGSDTRPFLGRYTGRISYTDRLEKTHPGYIRQLYRYAEKTVGNQATFQSLANTMNKKSAVHNRNDGKPLTKFNKWNLWRWFKQQGGAEKSPREKPYLTDDQKKERKAWCVEILRLIRRYGDEFYACFLDEKWFYTTSRRRKLKVLPAGIGEDPIDVAPCVPTAISCRHALKV